MMYTSVIGPCNFFYSINVLSPLNLEQNTYNDRSEVYMPCLFTICNIREYIRFYPKS